LRGRSRGREGSRSRSRRYSSSNSSICRRGRGSSLSRDIAEPRGGVEGGARGDQRGDYYQMRGGGNSNGYRCSEGRWKDTGTMGGPSGGRVGGFTEWGRAKQQQQQQQQRRSGGGQGNGHAWDERERDHQQQQEWRSEAGAAAGRRSNGPMVRKRSAGNDRSGAVGYDQYQATRPHQRPRLSSPHTAEQPPPLSQRWLDSAPPPPPRSEFPPPPPPTVRLMSSEAQPPPTSAIQERGWERQHPTRDVWRADTAGNGAAGAGREHGQGGGARWEAHGGDGRGNRGDDGGGFRSGVRGGVQETGAGSLREQRREHHQQQQQHGAWAGQVGLRMSP
jgi:hypothetical protein